MERTRENVVDQILLLKLYILVNLPLFGLTTMYSCSTFQDSSCLFNRTCSTDHSTDSQVLECSSEITSNNTTQSSYADYNITECRPGKVCANRIQGLSDDYMFLVKYVQIQVKPVNVSHFTVNISWGWYPNDYNESINILRGYELRIQEGSSTVKCLCIEEPALRSISLGSDNAFRYNASSGLKMNVELSTYPVGVGWGDPRFYTRDKCTNWPSICSGSLITCLPALLSAPILSMSVLTEGGFKVLELSWTKPALNVNMYYIELLGSLTNESLTLFVNGSNNVRVTGLSSFSKWSARVQGFSLCSGMAAFYSGQSNTVGCGPWSEVVAEQLADPETSTILSTSSSQSTTSLNIIVIVVVPCVLVMAIGLASALCALCLYLCWRYKYKRKTMYPYQRNNEVDLPMNPVQYDKPGKLDALVLYSLGSPELERIEIEKEIVAYLKLKRFKVISCNDHTEKTVMQWVEENARLAHAVFIVCNKNFYLDWKMKSRSQLMNSIAMIVESAVGQNKIKKYATIKLRSGDDKYIPDNLYFKGMKSFLMGRRASQEEKSRFISFIKLNSS